MVQDVFTGKPRSDEGVSAVPAGCELRDLGGGAGVNAVEDRRAERTDVLSHKNRQGPTPLTQTPRIGLWSAAWVSSRVIDTTSSHQTRSASTSAQPGRGRDMSCGRLPVATTVPSCVASTALVVPVPRSTPSNNSVTSGSLRTCPGRTCQAVGFGRRLTSQQPYAVGLYLEVDAGTVLG